MPKVDPQYRYEPVYMEKNALMFLRQWPNPPEVLKAVSGRLAKAGILMFVTGDPGHFVLSPIGEYLKTIVDSQTFSFFNFPDVLRMWDTQLLANRDARASEFLRLFQTDWNDEQVRRYISKRFEVQDYLGDPATMAIGNLAALIQMNKMARERLGALLKAVR